MFSWRSEKPYFECKTTPLYFFIEFFLTFKGSILSVFGVKVKKVLTIFLSNSSLSEKSFFYCKGNMLFLKQAVLDVKSWYFCVCCVHFSLLR